jgi:hypothetical protein
MGKQAFGKSIETNPRIQQLGIVKDLLLII